MHHLHDPSVFWKTIKNLASPGAILFHRDLRRPSTYQEAIGLQKKYLSDAPDILIKDYLASLKAAFTVEEVRTQLLKVSLDYLNVIEVEDRYLEVIGRFGETSCQAGLSLVI